jgi:hypothetical protein
MKPSLSHLIALILVAFVLGLAAAPRSAQGRTLTDINVIPARVLKRSVSPNFYKTLLVSPVEGWVVVRGSLSGTRLMGLRIVHSELGGRWDSLAIQRAQDVVMAGNTTIENPNTKTSVLLHLLIYKIADGTLALSFAHLDEPGGNQMAYYGCARLAVLKSDGKWTEIKGPESLEGKGWAVRRGPKDSLEATVKFDMLQSRGPEASNMSTGR